MTDPPIVGDVGVVVGRRFGVPVLVISQDVFPEIATELGRLQNPAVIGVLRTLVARLPPPRRPHRRDRGDDAAPARAEGRSAGPPARDPELGGHGRDHAAAARQRLGAGQRARRASSSSCTRATSGTRRTSTASSARRRSSATSTTCSIVIAGFGARHSEMVELAERLEVTDHVRFLPYQKRKRLSLSLSSADLHVVGLAKGLAGYVVPSRLYGVLAAGRPVIAAAEEDSETARLVSEVGCGIVVEPGRPELLARTIRAARDGAYDLEAHGGARPGVRRAGSRPVGRDEAVPGARRRAPRRVGAGPVRPVSTPSRRAATDRAGRRRPRDA